MWGAKIFLGGNFTYTGLPQPTASVSAGPQCRFLADLITYWEPFKIQLLNLVPHTVNFIYARCQGQNQLWPGLVMLQAPQSEMLLCRKTFIHLNKNMHFNKENVPPSNRISFWKLFLKHFSTDWNRDREISAIQFRRQTPLTGPQLSLFTRPVLLGYTFIQVARKQVSAFSGHKRDTCNIHFWTRQSGTKLNIPYLKHHICGLNPKLRKIIGKMISLTSLPAAGRNKPFLLVFLNQLEY